MKCRVHLIQYYTRCTLYNIDLHDESRQNGSSVIYKSQLGSRPLSSPTPAVLYSRLVVHCQSYYQSYQNIVPFISQYTPDTNLSTIHIVSSQNYMLRLSCYLPEHVTSFVQHQGGKRTESASISHFTIHHNLWFVTFQTVKSLHRTEILLKSAIHV